MCLPSKLYARGTPKVARNLLPVAQSMVNVGFGYIALIYALGFGLCGLWATVASFRASHSNITLPRETPQWFPERIFMDVEYPKEDLRILTTSSAISSLYFLLFPAAVYYYYYFHLRRLRTKMLGPKTG